MLWVSTCVVPQEKAPNDRGDLKDPRSQRLPPHEQPTEPQK